MTVFILFCDTGLLTFILPNFRAVLPNTLFANFLMERKTPFEVLFITHKKYGLRPLDLFAPPSNQNA